MTKSGLARMGGIVIIAALLLSCLTWSDALAAPKKKKKSTAKRKIEKIFFLKTDLGLAYDDNIIDYSEGDLATFDSLSNLTKFSGLKSRNDWILTPQIRPEIRGRFLGGQQASLAFEFDYYLYMRNDIRRYSKFTLEGKHYIIPGGYVQATYTYVPNYFYRNEFNGYSSYIDSTVTPPRRRQLAKYDKAEFAKNLFAAEAGYDITKSLKGSAIYEYQHKSFNPDFLARNININRGEVDGIWKATSDLKVWAYYGLERGKSKFSQSQDTLDVSYDAWDITLGGRHNIPAVSQLKPDVFISLQYRRIKYQTLNYQDIYRVGRKDNNYLIRIGTSLETFYGVRTEISYTYFKKDSNVPDLYPDPGRNILLTVAQIEKELNYNSNTITFRFSRDF